MVNLGTGVATETPVTSTVNGLASIQYMQGEGTPWVSDGTNFQIPGDYPQYAWGASTVAGTGCTPSASSITSFGKGTITLAATCTAVTITFKVAAKTGWACTFGDRTEQAAGTYIPHWGESATTTTTVTMPVPAAASTTAIITVQCDRY
jgi:hypothetical protein